MKINIKATNTTLTPAITEYVNKKIDALQKFTGQNDDSLMADVEVGVTTHHHNSGNIFRAEVNLFAKGKQFRATCEDADLYAAIDKVKDELAEELRSHRKKEVGMFRRGGAAIKNLLKGFGRKGDN